MADERSLAALDSAGSNATTIRRPGHAWAVLASPGYLAAQLGG